MSALVAALIFYGFGIEPDQLGLTRYEIRLDHAPHLQGLKIIVIADLHGGAPFIDDAKIARVVALANGAHPDLILLTGDLSAHVIGSAGMPVAHVIQKLKVLSAPLGVYAVIGNHDRLENAARVTALLEKAGIAVLENAHLPLRGGQRSFHLVGIGDAHHHADVPELALFGVPQGADALCFTHSPDAFPALPGTCALTIAGHTHGGQVRLPLVGALYVPSRYGQHYLAGTIREGGKTLFVATGIGTSILGVRLGVPPEIALLEIR